MDRDEIGRRDSEVNGHVHIGDLLWWEWGRQNGESSNDLALFIPHDLSLSLSLFIYQAISNCLIHKAITQND